MPRPIVPSGSYGMSWVPDYTMIEGIEYGSPLRMQYFTLKEKLEQAEGPYGPYKGESYEDARNEMKAFLNENELRVRENMRPRYETFIKEMERETGGRRKRRTRKHRRSRRRSLKH